MILTGAARIGRDAELRFLPSGDPVINLSLAYNFGRRGEDGSRPTQWVEVVLFGKRAESLAPHLTKGKSLWIVVTDVHIETFEKSGGGQGHKLTGRLEHVDFISPSQTPGGAGQGESHTDTAARSKARAETAAGLQRDRAHQHGSKAQGQGTGFDDMDDDLPF